MARRIRIMSPENVDSAVSMEERVEIEDKVASAVLNAASGSGDANTESSGIDDAQEVSYAFNSLRANTQCDMKSNAARHLRCLAAGQDRVDPSSCRVGSRTRDGQRRRSRHAASLGCDK